MSYVETTNEEQANKGQWEFDASQNYEVGPVAKGWHLFCITGAAARIAKTGNPYVTFRFEVCRPIEKDPDSGRIVIDIYVVKYRTKGAMYFARLMQAVDPKMENVNPENLARLFLGKMVAGEVIVRNETDRDGNPEKRSRCINFRTPKGNHEPPQMPVDAHTWQQNNVKGNPSASQNGNEPPEWTDDDIPF